MSLLKKRVHLLVAVLALFSLVAAACGDDDDETTTAEPSPEETAEDPGEDPAEDPGEDPAEDPGEDPAEDPTAEPAEQPADGTPIKLAIVYSETGRSASAYNTVDTVGQAWAEWVNTEMGA